MASPPSSGTALKIVICTILLLAICTWITVSGIAIPMQPVNQVNLAASPYGYTRSLVLVIGPFLVLLYWYLVYPNRHRPHAKCLLRIAGITAVTWFLLDIFFAPSIFYFPNCGATLGPPGWRLPGYLPGSGFQLIIPIEEFVFYLFSVLALLMIYIWFSEVWFGNNALSPSDHHNEALQVIPIGSFNPVFLIVGLILVFLAYLYQSAFGYIPTPPPVIPSVCEMPQPHAFTSGKVFPLYFTLLVALIVIPSMFLYNKIKIFVNTGALHMTILVSVMVSVIWESTMGIPYGWWGYQPDYMLGIYVPPWFNLPIESALLWISSSWGMVFLYELMRLSCVTGVNVFSLLLGHGSAGSPPGSKSSPS